MPTFHTNPGPFTFDARSGQGHFRPVGSIRHIGTFKPNPTNWATSDIYSARLIVGFNVGGKARWDLEDLIDVVRAIRDDQHADPSATFLAQKGIYKHQNGHDVVEEDGGQVLIIKMSGSVADFIAEMGALAEQIALQFKQETVILEIQKNGVTHRLGFVTPPELPKARNRRRK